MLVKLARYLRVLGLDASYDVQASLATRIERADAQGRVFLTRNRRIGYQTPAPRRMVVLESEDPVVQVREVCASLGIDPRSRLFSRCIRCNVELEPAVKGDRIAERVPAGVLARYREFWDCPSCGTVFWRGSHVRNTCRKLGLADASESP